MNLRDYQKDFVASVELKFKEFRRLLGVLPTGGGKTICFSQLAKNRADAGQRTCILAHREELIDQAIAKLHAATGIVAEREKAESHASLSAPVVVASVQTMIRRLDDWPADHFGLIVADEAHHCISPSWLSVLNHFDAQVLGVTASPHRGDAKDLGQFFEAVAYEIGMFQLIDDGWLSPIVMKSIPLSIDLAGVRRTAGDLNEVDLGNALEPYLGRIAASIAQHASFRRTLAFLPLRATSRKFVDACRAAGLAAEHIDGESPDRKEILARFARGEMDVLSNAMLLTEGYDDPGLDCVVVLRPTKSQPLYCQMVGRGTRIADGKQDLLLLDYLWANHKVCRPAHLIAKTDVEAEIITQLSQDQAALPADLAAQMPLDLQVLANDCTVQREEALRKKLDEHKGKKAKTLSAEEFSAQHHRVDVADYEPTMAWESAAVSEAQAKYLKRAKIDLSTVKDRGHASKLIDIYFSENKPRLAAPKVMALMQRMEGLCHSIGIHNLDAVTTDQAGRFFKALKERNQNPELV